MKKDKIDIKAPSPERAQKALQLLRQAFLDMNPELITKIENYKVTKTFSGTIGGKDGHHFDFKDFFEVLETGFYSPYIRDLFESFLHLYFFKTCTELRVNIEDYIEHDTFNQETYIETSKALASVVTSLNIIEIYTFGLLGKFGIKKEEFLKETQNNYEKLREFLRIIRAAKNCKLQHYGDCEFILSKIRINDKPFHMTKDVTLKDNIIYTENPEQIISMAAAAKPGIYLIANIPYEQKVNLTFYFLFVNDSDALLVENNKHSYRDQIYRTKTDGRGGEDAWLGRRYEHVQLPLEEVLDFFENKSTDKSVIPAGSDFSFMVIKKLSECHPAHILWVQSFVDNCIQQFNTTDILQHTSYSLATEFIKLYEKDTASQLPTLYRKNLPGLSDFDLTRDTAKIDIDSRNNGSYLVPLLSEIPVLDVFENPPFLGPTSKKQIEAALTYERRKITAKKLEKKNLKKTFWLMLSTYAANFKNL